MDDDVKMAAVISTAIAIVLAVLIGGITYNARLGWHAQNFAIAHGYNQVTVPGYQEPVWQKAERR